jgi:hypothetical protein
MIPIQTGAYAHEISHVNESLVILECLFCFPAQAMKSPISNLVCSAFAVSFLTMHAPAAFSDPAPVPSTVIDNLSSTPLPGQFGIGPTFSMSDGYEVASIFESGLAAGHINSITLRFATTYADGFLISLRSVVGGLPLDSSLATDPLSIPASVGVGMTYDFTSHPANIYAFALQPNTTYALVLSESLNGANWIESSPPTGYTTSAGFQVLATKQKLPYLGGWIDRDPVIYQMNLQPVPGPLPAFGIFVGYRQSRRIRRRLQLKR